ncbi:YjcB family protein, partial [Salmonella enterica subsp. enterica serovar Lubbock]|nr:YjcB family protein [Salmonella enterica subsp. enterica serovar Lubbock]
VVSACWFATGLLGITMMDLAAIWHNIEAVMVETMSQTPPEWPPEKPGLQRPFRSRRPCRAGNGAPCTPDGV